MPRPTQVRVVISGDGKRGHENQSRVLARMLGDSEPLLMRLRNPEGGWGETLLRAAFAIRGRWQMPKRSAGERVRELMRPESPAAFRDFSTEVGKNRDTYRVFTISTGTPPATGNLLLSCLLDAEPLCVMTPSLVPRRLFKLRVLPLHDVRPGWARAAEVYTPLALSYHDQVAAQLQAGELAREAGLDPQGRYWAVAIGGTGRSGAWDKQEFEQTFTAYVQQAADAGVKLLITTSRRTPPESTIFAREAAGSHTAFFLDAMEDDRNPLPAFYELAEDLAVTSDSFSMLSEAIQAGFCPYVMHLGKPRRKLRRGLYNLAARGMIRHEQSVPILQSQGSSGRIFEINRFYNELRTEVRSRLDL